METNKAPLGNFANGEKKLDELVGKLRLNKIPTGIKFGDLVKDSVTGFEGIFTGDANYLHGDRQIQITGTTLNSDGGTREEWFYASRVVAAQ